VPFIDIANDSYTTALYVGVPIVGGTLTLSGRNPHRRSLSFTVSLETDMSLLPKAPGDILTPFGNLLAIAFNGPDGHRIPGGLFVIVSSTVTDSAGILTCQVMANDVTWLLSQRLFTAPYSVASSPLSSVIEAIFAQQMPNLKLTYDLAPASGTVEVMSFRQGANPWQACQTMASAAGLVVFENAQGYIQAIAQPDPQSQPVVWKLGTNGDQPILSVTRTFSRQGSPNDFYVTGPTLGTQRPPFGQSADTAGASPTAVSGAYGDCPSFTSNSQSFASGQCSAAARRLLLASIGQTDILQLEIHPNPALEVYDVVEVVDDELGLNAHYILDTVSMPLGWEQRMRLTARQVVTGV
jgi:hypothetical protein